ncbi:MAG: GNAT family N-acetyltransferase [Roseiflexaceae bacterium]
MHTTHPAYTRTLADGSLLRWATPADADAYAQLAEASFTLPQFSISNPNVGPYARDMASGNHPLCQPSDIAVVCAANGEMLAAAALLTQPLQYAGIDIPVGRPELICSSPHVRQRGYVREIMHLLHHKSSARGDFMQAITGIPNYYHQFGYVWSVDYNEFRTVQLANITTEADGYTIRLAHRDEYDTFVTLYDNERSQRTDMLSTPYTAAYFQHALVTSCSREQHVPHFICLPSGEIIGFVTMLAYSDEEGGVCITGLGFAPNASPHQHFLHTLAALKAYAYTLPKAHPHFPAVSKLYIQVDAHPAWAALFGTYNLLTLTEPPYTWYLRVPDFVPLIWHMRTLLEQRLAASTFRGYSGSLILWFYRHGLEMVWQNGILQHVHPWTAPAYGEPFHATYPPGIFAQQLFGWRAFHELHHWRKDVWAQRTAIPLIDTLFPKKPSWFLWSN